MDDAAVLASGDRYHDDHNAFHPSNLGFDGKTRRVPPVDRDRAWTGDTKRSFIFAVIQRVLKGDRPNTMVQCASLNLVSALTDDRL